MYMLGLLLLLRAKLVFIEKHVNIDNLVFHGHSYLLFYCMCDVIVLL